MTTQILVYVILTDSNRVHMVRSGLLPDVLRAHGLNINYNGPQSGNELIAYDNFGNIRWIMEKRGVTKQEYEKQFIDEELK